LEGFEIIIAGDTNFACDPHNERHRQCYSLLSSYVNHCDDFIVNSDRITYVSDALGQCSFIDHMFVSESVRQDIISGVICDSGANLSDHMPVIYSNNLSLTLKLLP